MKIIGLTGGIGAGKSTVADIFRTLGIPVYVADQRGKDLMQHDPALKSAISQLLGSQAYGEDGVLNNAWIASQVFPNPELLDQLNALVHPAVAQDVLTWSQQPDQAKAPYLIKESALLFEESLTDQLDATILVIANVETRIARVMQRDNVSREKVEQRIRNQWPDDRKIPMADYIIYNDSDRSLIEQVRSIDGIIRFDSK
jgi:dephospho-CoA kinase